MCTVFFSIELQQPHPTASVLYLFTVRYKFHAQCPPRSMQRIMRSRALSSDHGNSSMMALFGLDKQLSEELAVAATSICFDLSTIDLLFNHLQMLHGSSLFGRMW